MKTCPVCGKTLERKSYEGRKTFEQRRCCSRECADEYKRMQSASKVTTRYCEHCGGVIPINPNKHISLYALRRFCSGSCSRRHILMDHDTAMDNAVRAYLDDYAVAMEIAQCAVMDFPIRTLAPRVKRLWCPVRHHYYTALIGEIR